MANPQGHSADLRRVVDEPVRDATHSLATEQSLSPSTRWGQLESELRVKIPEDRYGLQPLLSEGAVIPWGDQLHLVSKPNPWQRANECGLSSRYAIQLAGQLAGENSFSWQTIREGVVPVRYGSGARSGMTHRVPFISPHEREDAQPFDCTVYGTVIERDTNLSYEEALPSLKLCRTHSDGEIDSTSTPTGIFFLGKEDGAFSFSDEPELTHPLEVAIHKFLDNGAQDVRPIDLIVGPDDGGYYVVSGKISFERRGPQPNHPLKTVSLTTRVDGPVVYDPSINGFFYPGTAETRYDFSIAAFERMQQAVLSDDVQPDSCSSWISHWIGRSSESEEHHRPHQTEEDRVAVRLLEGNGRALYALTTGFFPLQTTQNADELIERLSRN